MKVTSVAQAAYRFHSPRWSYTPLSGAGAANHGGRANRIGVGALYLALEESTALAEYRQRSVLVPPALLVSYTVAVEKVVDFRDGYDAAQWDPLWQDFGCDWQKLWFADRVEPPSWVVGDMVLAAGMKGILFRSSRTPTGTNLVLYTEHLTSEDVVEVYDPRGDLPKNQESWR